MHNYTVTQMYPTTYRKRIGGSEETTKKCVSFPQHEENLIDDWKILSKMDYVSESQYVRKLIRDEEVKDDFLKTADRLQSLEAKDMRFSMFLDKVQEEK